MVISGQKSLNSVNLSFPQTKIKNNKQMNI